MDFSTIVTIIGIIVTLISLFFGVKHVYTKKISKNNSENVIHQNGNDNIAGINSDIKIDRRDNK